MAGGSYYRELNISNTEFTQLPTVNFETVTAKILIVSDTLINDIEYSYNGRDVEGKIKWSDEKIELSGITISKMWFRTNNPTDTELRVWARV